LGEEGRQITTTDRECVFARHTGIGGLQFLDPAPQDAGPGEVRLRVEAFALNRDDMGRMPGRYSVNFGTLPARLERAASTGPAAEDLAFGPPARRDRPLRPPAPNNQ